MSTKILKSNNGYNSRSYELPDKCIHCGITMSPEVINVTPPNFNNRVAITLQCSSPNCAKFIVQEYKMFGTDNTVRIDYNYAPLIDNVPDILKEKFPEFYAAYTEAREVESDGHKRSAGMAYRFSLETLIKDYAKLQLPDKSESIDSLMTGQLSKVISTLMMTHYITCLQPRHGWVMIKLTLSQNILTKGLMNSRNSYKQHNSSLLDNFTLSLPENLSKRAISPLFLAVLSNYPKLNLLQITLLLILCLTVSSLRICFDNQFYTLFTSLFILLLPSSNTQLTTC